MKQLSKIIFFTAVLGIFVWSCKKDENKIYFEGGTAPVLSASSTSALVLSGANASSTALKFNWTNPDYRFTTGVSSQDVTYILEVDTLGANFTSPDKQSVSISKNLGVSFTVKELNTLLTKLNLVENIVHKVQFRVKATLANSSVPLISNVVDVAITPYLDVAVPIPTNGTLWITGDAAPSGWDNPLSAPEDVTQKFTAVSNTLYELTLTMPGGGAYKLIQENGQWGSQYHMLAGGKWDAGEFEKKDSDPGFPGPPSAGTYKITVNFKTGKYTVVKQ